jgi:DNA-binding NarL/FixJ family response regulator
MVSPAQNSKNRESIVARAPGFLLPDARQRPIFYNAEAEQILNYWASGRGERQGRDGVAEAVRAILARRNCSNKGAESGPEILSGRRRYCWPKITAVLIEVCRPANRPNELPNLAREYRLTDREGETVSHSNLGLTSKEIAQRMQVSPNTVKVFLCSIMSKMSVSTRSGIPGKLMQQSSESRLSF